MSNEKKKKQKRRALNLVGWLDMCCSCSGTKANVSKVFSPKATAAKTWATVPCGQQERHFKGGSLAVERESEDPYWDFKHSMVQMILENEIYSKEGLTDLLTCFLELNAPHHHGVILRAFAEIFDAVPRIHMRVT